MQVRGSRATCYLQTLKYKQAIADFKKLLTLEPQNQLVRTQLDSTQKIMRRTEFEKVLLTRLGGTAGLTVRIGH
jgi:cytochrome c-type biogenesis protein CcmH/NrfG